MIDIHKNNLYSIITLFLKEKKWAIFFIVIEEFQELTCFVMSARNTRFK